MVGRKTGLRSKIEIRKGPYGDCDDGIGLGRANPEGRPKYAKNSAFASRRNNPLSKMSLLRHFALELAAEIPIRKHCISKSYSDPEHRPVSSASAQSAPQEESCQVPILRHRILEFRLGLS
jgi:hypothetical protein